MRSIEKYKKIFPALGLVLLTFFFCWFFVGRYGVFGSRVDWISQHSVIPDYFRQQFYETGDLFPEFAANIGGGQNIYYFSYYGLFSPVILLSYLFPSVKMGDYLMFASLASLAVSVILFYTWLLKRGFSGKIRFMVSLMYLLSGPMIFHSYCQIMFVNYMPFLCMAFIGVDLYFEKGRKLLYMAGVFLMIMSSFYFSIGGMLALVIYGLNRYLECGPEGGHFLGSDLWYSSEKNIVSNINDKADRKETKKALIKIKIACNYIFLFLEDGAQFLCPMLAAVLLSGILLVPTAAALTGRGGTKGGIHPADLLIPDTQVDRLLYTPYGIGLTTFMVTVLIAGFTYKKLSERVLSWGCTVILSIPFFTWILNGGLYIREKALIPFLPLLCYLIAYYIKRLEEGQLASRSIQQNPSATRFVGLLVGGIPFLATTGLLYAGQGTSEFSEYGMLFLADAVIMAGGYLLFCWKKESMFLLVPVVAFLFLYGSVFHEKADRIESREFYDKVTDPATGQIVKEIIEEDPGFYRLEQVGNEEENAADLNRVWNMGQYISSIYSSSYNKEYQEFRKNVFEVEEPFRNDLMQSVSQNPVFLKLMGVRYLLSEKEVPGYENVGQKGNIRVFRDMGAAPAAYVTDRLISEKSFEKLQFPYNQLALIFGAVKAGEGEKQKEDGERSAAASETAAPLEMADISQKSEALETAEAMSGQERQILEEVKQAVKPVEIGLPEQKDGNLRITQKGDSYRIQADKKDTVRIEIPGLGDGRTAEAERILFLQFHVKNNQPGKDVSVWLEGERNKLSAGNHTYYNGNTIFSFAAALEKGKSFAELAFGKGDYELTGIKCFLGSWGKEVDQERAGRLYQAEFQMDKEKSGGNVIAGFVEVEKEGYFVTSIPYDPNFEILVDGKETEYEKVNTAFLGFPVGEGRHTVEMAYHAPGRKIGICCSVAGAVFAVLLAGFVKIRMTFK